MNLPDIGYPQTKDVADEGYYVCINCSHDEPSDKSIAILNTKDKLPKCPVCGDTYWMKIQFFGVRLLLLSGALRLFEENPNFFLILVRKSFII